MSQQPNFPIHDARVQAAVARRADRLLKDLQSANPPAHPEISVAIKARGTDTEFDVLARLLRDEDAALRQEAARWIEDHARQSDPPATPGWEEWLLCEESDELLLDGLVDPDPQVRLRLLRAYSVLKFGDAADALPLLVESLTAEQTDLRIEALRTLPAVGRDLASGVVEQISSIADDPVAEVRGEAYSRLAWLDADGGAAVLTLVTRVAEEDDRDLKRKAAHAVLCVDPLAVELSSVKEPSLRESLLQALSELGEPARELRQRLPHVWRSSDETRFKYVWLNMEEVARYLNRDGSTIRRWLEKGRLRHHAKEGSGSGILYAWRPDELARVKEFSRNEESSD